MAAGPQCNPAEQSVSGKALKVTPINRKGCKTVRMSGVLQQRGRMSELQLRHNW